MTEDRIKWAWRGQSIEVGFETRGKGPAVLMLSALSSISTRAEMRPLAEQLGSTLTTTAVDWPGFGDLPRPAIAWEPDAYRAFLAFMLAAVSTPFATVAAGHAAGYLIEHAAVHPGSAGRLCLVAPTWRGPLPTMMGSRRAAFRYVSQLVDVPMIGSALYRLNVNSPMIRMMARGHVRRPCALSRRACASWLWSHLLAPQKRADHGPLGALVRLPDLVDHLLPGA